MIFLSFLFLVLTSVVPILGSPSHQQGETEAVYENQTIENTYFEFYQEPTIIFRNNILRNVSISVSEATNVTLIGNSFTDPADITVIIWKSSNVLIAENDFQDVPESAIQVYESHDITLIQNIINLSDGGSNQFAIYEGVKIDRSSDTLIDGNEIYSPLGDGLSVFNSPRTSIIGNIIDQSGFMGLGITLSDNCLIQDNTIIYSSNFGRTHSGDIPKSSAFGLSSSNNIAVEFNTISQSDNNGLDVYNARHLTVRGNTLSGHKVAGMFLGVVQNATIVDNIFVDNPVGIEVNDVSDITYENNIFEGGVSITSYSSKSPFVFPISIFICIIILKKRN